MYSVTHQMLSSRFAPATVSSGVTLDHATIGMMKVGRFATDQSCVIKHPLALPASAASHVFIVVQLKGHSVLKQHGRSMQLSPGTWGLCDAPSPCVATHQAGVEQVHFLIPKDQIRLGIDARFVVGRTFGGASRVSALLCQTIKSLFEELPALGPRQAEDLADVVARLLQLAVHERIQQPKNLSTRDEMCERICTYVDNHLRDPRLTLDLIATDLNCTKRYLHMVFASREHTLNHYIWNQRLEHCNRDLANPAFNSRSVTEIAMCWGFSNLSHFSRAFRELYGLSPREARRS
jgi:AraC-like DNA-binding protein